MPIKYEKPLGATAAALRHPEKANDLDRPAPVEVLTAARTPWRGKQECSQAERF